MLEMQTKPGLCPGFVVLAEALSAQPVFDAVGGVNHVLMAAGIGKTHVAVARERIEV
jgi:hypothetical protein